MRAALRYYYYTSGGSEPSTWILATGIWRDEGIWDDNELWID